ncbi:DMT family transporter [Desulfitobacterium hafniense]|uniref:DMT family transporter n=1 Tax=Desulfitobacterium hafniense TaxID=49338 RepID=UPI0003657B46|nr:DMT family transporter [Desulfitobacterium hafniense]
MKNGYVLIILAALGFAALPIFIKYGYNVGLTTEVMLFLRFLIASVLLGFIMLVNKKELHMNKSDLPKLIVHGLVFFGSSYCYTLAIKHMSASVTNILLYTYPLMVVLMATMIFKEKVSLVKALTLLLSFLGCLMVIDVIHTSTHQISMLGILYGIGSAIFYAVYNINGQYLSKTLEPVTISTYTSVVCLFATMVIYPPVDLFAGHSFQAMWIVGLGTAILSTIIPLFCYQKGISLLGASQASILSNIEPVIATVLAFLILGETLSVIQLSGAFLIILGGLLLKLDKGKQPSTLSS